LTYFWTKVVTKECVHHWDLRSPEEFVFTDASDFGLGAHTSDINASSLVSGLWDVPDSTKHITFKELKVV
jgi:hypothetical protein